MKIKAVLVDDERKLTEVLLMKLEQFCPDVEVLGDARNVSDAYDLIMEHKPDLVFLDISMPGGTGFDLLDKFDDLFFEVIFVTSYNEYAIKAFKKSAIDYLLKPLDSSELVKAVSKAKEHLSLKNKVERYEALVANITTESSSQKTVVIPDQKTYKFVKESDIIRCEGWQKYTKIYTKNSEEILSSNSIGYFKEILSKDTFYATHRSHLINSDFIESYSIEGVLLLSDGSKVPVARNKKQDFKERFLLK